MRYDEALDKLYEVNQGYKNLSSKETSTLVLGFIDGFKISQEQADKKLKAYAAYVAGQITMAELEQVLKDE